MFQLASAESVQTVMRSLGDPNEEKIKLVCPTNSDHDLWYPIGLLDVEPAPWCMCVPLDSTVPLSEVDNRMRPA